MFTVRVASTPLRIRAGQGNRGIEKVQPISKEVLGLPAQVLSSQCSVGMDEVRQKVNSLNERSKDLLIPAFGPILCEKEDAQALVASVEVAIFGIPTFLVLSVEEISRVFFCDTKILTIVREEIEIV